MDGQGNEIRVLHDATACMKEALSQCDVYFEKIKEVVSTLKKLDLSNDTLLVELDSIFNGTSDLLVQVKRKRDEYSLERRTQGVAEQLSSASSPADRKALTEQHVASLLAHQADCLSFLHSLINKKLLEPAAQLKAESCQVDTMSWLSAAQTNYSLRQLEGFTPSDFEHILFGLSANQGYHFQLRSKVLGSIRKYSEELKTKVDSPFRNLCGGFHSNPTAIEQILRECSSSWEARSAGAPPPILQEGVDPPIKHVWLSLLRVGEESVGPAQESLVKQNMADKRELLRKQLEDLGEEAFERVLQSVYHHSNPALTTTPSKVAAQLLYGVADFVAVTPQYSQLSVMEVKRRGRRLEVITSSQWRLRADRLVAMVMGQSESLGVVRVKYNQELDLDVLLGSRLAPPPPKLAVTLTQALDPAFLYSQAYDGWPNGGLPFPSPSHGESHAAAYRSGGSEVSDEGEEPGSFQRGRIKPIRKKPSRSKDLAAPPGGGGVVGAGAGGGVKKEEEDYDSSSSGHTGTTVRTQTMGGDPLVLSGPVDILQTLGQGQAVLTAGALKEQEAKRRQESHARSLNTEESASQRAAVRKGPSQPQRSRGDDRPGVPPSQLDSAIGALSLQGPYCPPDQRYPTDRTSDYSSMPGSRSGSFRTDIPYTQDFLRGSGDRSSGSMPSHRGHVTPGGDPWGGFPHMQKAGSSASLLLHAEHGMQQQQQLSDRETPEWGRRREDYGYHTPGPDEMMETMSERSYQGSDTSLSAAQYREQLVAMPRHAPSHPGRITRSRSLEDIRKVAPSPAGQPEKWDSSQSLAPAGTYDQRYFPDPSRVRPAGGGANKSLPPSRENSLTRRDPRGFPHSHPHPHMPGRQPVPSPGPPPSLPQGHPLHGMGPRPPMPAGGQYPPPPPSSASPYHMQPGYREFSPSPSHMRAPYRPQGPPGPHPPPNHNHDGFMPQMIPRHHRPHPNWDTPPHMFQPVPYGNYGPSPQPTPPATPPPRDGRYPTHPSPGPQYAPPPPHHGMMQHDYHDPYMGGRGMRRRSPGPGPHGHLGPAHSEQYIPPY